MDLANDELIMQKGPIVQLKLNFLYGVTIQRAQEIAQRAQEIANTGISSGGFEIEAGSIFKEEPMEFSDTVMSFDYTYEREDIENSVEKLLKDSPLLRQARDFARTTHKNQAYDGKPYVTEHLDKVVVNLNNHLHHPDDIALAVAYLHDVLEDTQTSIQTLRNVFGSTIAQAVYDVTDGEGNNREERQMLTYARTRENNLSLLVKLADRITNMKASKNTKYANIYVKEYPRFKGSLMKYRYSPILEETIYRMWDTLDILYKELKSSIHEES